MRPLSNLPDGKSVKVRSVPLEPHTDALVIAHMRQGGFSSLSATLRDIVDRGLASIGIGGVATDPAARAYREAARKIEEELRAHVRASLLEALEQRGVQRPRVKAKR